MPIYEGKDNDLMKIELADKLEPTTKAKIDIEYNITIPNLSHRFGYTDKGTNLANFYPIACVYDQNGWSKNPYHFNGDPFYSEMANYYVNFSCDSSLVCAFSGKAVAVKCVLLAFIRVLSFKKATANGKEQRRASRPEFGIALPHIFTAVCLG
jgi:hypothetical protein